MGHEKEDKYIQSVKDESHILQKEQVCNDLTTYMMFPLIGNCDMVLRDHV